MTVNSYDPRRISAGNGATKIFDAPFITDAADLLVLLVNGTTGAEVEQILNTDYTLTNVGNQAGSTVTMAVAPLAGFLLDRRRDPDQTQTTHFIEGEDEPATSKEATLDRMVMMIQALTLLMNNISAGTVHVPFGESAITIPTIAQRKGKALTFDPNTGMPSATLLRVAQFLFLNVPPLDSQGSDNDVAIISNGDTYLKIAGAWALQGNLKGPTGSRGSINYTGATVPGAIVGVLDNDTYLQTGGAGLGDYYKRVAGAWVFQTNLRGASGAGTGDVVGPAGVADGRFALFDGATGKLIKQHTGAPGALAVKNTVAGATDIDAASIAYDRIAAAALASAAEVNTGAASKLVSSAAARASLAPVAVPYAASVALDLSQGCEFDIGALTGPLTLAAPINAYLGQPVVVWLPQDGTGGRAISVAGTNWKLGTFTPSTAASKVDMIKGVVRSLAPIEIHGAYQAGTK